MSLFITVCRLCSFSPPVKINKIEKASPNSCMWCALGCYIFNQSIFTFAEVSIACSLVLATSSGVNQNQGHVQCLCLTFPLCLTLSPSLTPLLLTFNFLALFHHCNSLFHPFQQILTPAACH